MSPIPEHRFLDKERMANIADPIILLRIFLWGSTHRYPLKNTINPQHHNSFTKTPIYSRGSSSFPEAPAVSENVLHFQDQSMSTYNYFRAHNLFTKTKLIYEQMFYVQNHSFSSKRSSCYQHNHLLSQAACISKATGDCNKYNLLSKVPFVFKPILYWQKDDMHLLNKAISFSRSTYFESRSIFFLMCFVTRFEFVSIFCIP